MIKWFKITGIIAGILLLAVSHVLGFSTNNTTVTRLLDKNEASIGGSITVTVNFTNSETSSLRGFYYADQIPQGLTVNTTSVKINGGTVSDYVHEAGSVGDVYPGNIVHRWILETPTAFSQNNPVSSGSTVQIVYSLSSTQAGTYNLDEFSWVGYYQGGSRAGFGHSEGSDKKSITIVPTISGNAGVAGATLSYTDGTPKTATADGSGNYSFSVSYNWSGTVTPTKIGFGFTPASRTYTNVVSNQTGQNYTAILQTFTISGTVTSGGSPLSGVTMSGLPGSPVTGADGSYSGTVTHAWSGTVMPQKTGCNFSPPSSTYTNVTSNQTQNYTETLQTLTISGIVTSGGSGISGVTMGGLPGNPSTAGDGSYSAIVDYGWSGTVTPQKTGYNFAPPSAGYANVTSNQTQNYTATLQTFTISGTVTSGGSPLSGVTMSGLPGSPVSDAGGVYSATVDYSWSGTVIPMKAGYSFNPPSITYNNVNSVQIQDYAAFLQIQSFPFFDNFSTDKGWLGYESGGWERGPAIAGGGENGNTDPAADYSSSDDNYILGYAIGGDYPNDLFEERSIVSPPVDCRNQDKVFVKFRRYLNVESNEFDRARVDLSINGTDWTQIWENPVVDLMDDEWVPFTIDISSIAANQGTVYVKFTMGPTNSSRRFSGWNIDDFEVTSEAVFPSEGTYGTELVIAGSGFGLKKEKVFIGSTALKVLEWADDLIRCRLTKIITPGIYDVVVQPSGPKGTPPIVEKEAFVVRAAEIHSIEPGEGSAYDQVTIKGKFFGTKTGKVYLEYEEGAIISRKRCKVEEWYMAPTTGESEIVFIVPKMLPEVCDIVVDPYGDIPEDEEQKGFTVEAPEIGSVAPNSGSAGEQIIVSGNFFGSKKGKVYLGYLLKGKPTKKSCSILSWDDDEIVFVVPNLPVAAYDVIVTNSVGSNTLAGGLEIK